MSSNETINHEPDERENYENEKYEENRDSSESNKSDEDVTREIRQRQIRRKKKKFFSHPPTPKIAINPKDDPTTFKGDYQIAICQDGRFAVTFDTGKIH